MPHAAQPPLLTGTPLADARSALILLHGRGASPESMLPLAAQLEGPGVHIVLPRAAGNAWYPYPFIAPKAQNEPFLSEALAEVRRQLAHLSERLGSTRVAIAGFSQGACLALESAVQFNRPLLAVAGFSGGLIGPSGTVWELSAGMTGTPVFLGCHEQDPHIPLARVRETDAVFRAKGAGVSLNVYPGYGHHLMPGAAEWLRDRLHAKG